MNSVSSLDYAVIVIYMGIILGVGFFFMRFNKSGADFFKGGNKIPWLVAGLSAFMAGFSAWTFTGAAGVAYKSGIAIVLMYIGNTCSFLLGYFIFAVRWRRSRVSTTMEYLSDRFDQRARQSFSWTTVLFDWFVVAATLYGMSVFVSVTCGFDLFWTIIVSSLIILLYCLVGGLWAVVITEFLQGIILIPFTIILAIASINEVGGIGAFFDKLPPEMLTLGGHTGEASWLYVICWTVMVSFGYNTRAHAQRYFSVTNEKAAKRVAILNIVLFLVGTLIWFIPPMAMRIIYPDLSEVWQGMANPEVLSRMSRPEEGSYAIASLRLLPNGLIGIMLTAMFSASMSTISGFYNIHSAIISKDILQTLFRWKHDEKRMLYMGRLTTLAVGIIVPIIAIFMARLGRSIFQVMVTFNTIISLAYGIPALLGFIIKKTPRWSGWLTFLLTVIVGSVGSFLLDWGLIQNVLIVIPCGLAVFLLSALFQDENRDYTKRRESFFRRLATPVDMVSEVGKTREVERSVFSFLARVTAFLAALCLVFLFWAKPGEAGVIIGYASITFVSAGAFFMLSFRARKTLTS